MTHEERLWAAECWRAGDTLEEIAPEVGCSPAELARHLNLYRPLPVDLRFRTPRGRGEGEFVGRLLKVVAIDRRLAGEPVSSIAADAGRSSNTLVGLFVKHGVAPFRGAA